MDNAPLRPRVKIVHAKDIAAFFQKMLAEVGPEETGASCDQNSDFAFIFHQNPPMESSIRTERQSAESMAHRRTSSEQGSLSTRRAQRRGRFPEKAFAGWAPGSTAVVVFEALDIILFEIVAVLDFDDLKGPLSGIFEAVFRPHGDKGALVCMNQERFVSPCHVGHP